ncbi:hypothetical protein [Anabaena sp. UHCC 0399]|uniref:hypothetical protein n=1 Tax=Anabaena sp. UHCC 0399 TaxID=3110238 RepID=UPI002B21E745|nr:hypothetical protein [Anabaena sp. UHCC 0399]MEA5567336.1 hypothetical protein [Anabaena sp. UHCC 0399]
MKNKKQKSIRRFITVGITSSILLTPVIPLLTNLTSTALANTTYLFPGRAEDLESGEYWYRRKEIHGSGSQKLGYDLTAIRFDNRSKNWTTDKPGTDGSKNEHKLIYGQPVYAVTGGKVIKCWRNAPDNPAPGQSHPGRTSNPKTIYGGGNHLTVDVGNGELILYAHLEPGSIPKSLCPISKEFTTDASNDSERTLTPAQQVTLKAGQFIGNVGNGGSSSGPHLHLHRSKGNTPLPLTFAGVWTKSTETNQDSDQDWKRLNNQALPPGKIAILPDFSQGNKEIARHGIPDSQYQFVFDQITKSGYRLEWIDGFSVNGKIYFNALFRPNNGVAWASFHNLTSSQYQAKFNQYTKAGYRPTQVESYLNGNTVLYAAIFAKDNGPSFTAYHGLSTNEHQKRIDDLTKNGWRPKNISVVSINGNRSYAALYEKTNVGSFVAKSFLTSAQYQQLFNENQQQGRQVAYLNAYQHNGQTRFTAIWNSVSQGTFKARHNLSSQQYQNEWESAQNSGLLTRNVTGYVDGNSPRYAGVWRK